MIRIVAQNELVTILGLFEFPRLLKRKSALQGLQDFLLPFCIGADKSLELKKLGARLHNASDSTTLDSAALANLKRKRFSRKQKGRQGDPAGHVEELQAR